MTSGITMRNARGTGSARNQPPAGRPNRRRPPGAPVPVVDGGGLRFEFAEAYRPRGMAFDGHLVL